MALLNKLKKIIGGIVSAKEDFLFLSQTQQGGKKSNNRFFSLSLNPFINDTVFMVTCSLFLFFSTLPLIRRQKEERGGKKANNAHTPFPKKKNDFWFYLFSAHPSPWFPSGQPPTQPKPFLKSSTVVPLTVFATAWHLKSTWLSISSTLAPRMTSNKASWPRTTASVSLLFQLSIAWPAR